MNRTNDAGVRLLLEAIGDGLPLGLAADEQALRWGEPFYAAVRRAGLGQVQCLEDGDRYACGISQRTNAHCHRVAQADADGIVRARCPLVPPMCPSGRFSRGQAVGWALTPTMLANWLGARLGFTAGVAARGDAIRIGERKLGNAALAAYFVMRPARVTGFEIDAFRAAESAQHLLVIGAHSGVLPPELVAAARARRHRVIGLDRLIDVVDGELTASLAGVADELAEDVVFDSSALSWPRYWMTFEPDKDRALIGEEGTEIDLSSKMGLVFRRLLRDRNKKVSNLELYRAGWRNIAPPAKGQGMAPADEQSVRDAVTALRRRISGALPGYLHEKFDVNTDRATSRGLGGYTLVVPDERVRWRGLP